MLEIVAQAVINGLLIGGIYALVSIGVTLIFGVVKIVNFAQGEFVMIGMYISFFLATQFGIDPIVSLVVSMPVLFVVGVLIQHFLIRRVLGLERFAPDLPDLRAVAADREPGADVADGELPHRSHLVLGRGLPCRRSLHSRSQS